METRDLIFYLTGTVHGEQVFTDKLHYMIKGNKMMSCVYSRLKAVQDFLVRHNF